MERGEEGEREGRMEGGKEIFSCPLPNTTLPFLPFTGKPLPHYMCVSVSLLPCLLQHTACATASLFFNCVYMGFS